MIKTALITGGAQRVGESFVNFLAKEGWNLVIHANNSIERANNMVALLTKQYPTQNFHAVKFDLSNWKVVKTFGSSVIEKFGQISLLINNASKYSSGVLKGMQNDLLEEMTAIHYFSPLMISNVIVEQEIEALIVNILDAAIVNSHTEHSAYLLAKKSLAELTKMSALEFAPLVRVNAIAPGPVLPVEGKSNDAFNTVVEQTPLKQEVTLDAMNMSLKYLIDNKNVTGQILYCDSGQHLI